ncbi:MAG: hypothetical protein K1W15_04760 [Lachnospiraceae bacterium]
MCNLNEFNVIYTEWGVCLYSTGINGKTNEIPEMQAVMKAYYGRSMGRVRKTIGRKPETELPLILAVLRVLYTNDLLDSIDELTK